MSSFQRFRFDSLFDIASGLSKPREEFGFGFPFLSYRDIYHNYFLEDSLEELANTTEQERDRCSIKRGDIFLTRTSETVDELGMSCVALKDYPNTTFNGFAKRLRIKSNTVQIHPEFIAYYLRSHYFRQQIDSMSVMTTRASLNNEMIGRLFVDLPSLADQIKIADVLKSLDDKIKVNKKINEVLESIAKTIFKEWFIDFGPVKAKAEGKKPFGMDAETAALFPDSFEDSELGPIPKGWKHGRLEEVAEVVGGGTPSTSESSYYCEPSTGISWISPKDLSGYSWKYISHGAIDITDSGLKNSSARMLPEGAILFSSRAPIGYVAIAEKDLCTNQGFKSLIPKNGSNAEFLYYLVKANIGLIESRASGSTFKEISGNGMKELPIIVPKNQVLEAFKKVTSEFSKLQKELRHETDNLKKTRDLILPKLISGEITLGGPE